MSTTLAQSVVNNAPGFWLGTESHAAQGHGATPPTPAQPRAPKRRATRYDDPAHTAGRANQRPGPHARQAYAARVLLTPAQPNPDVDNAVAELLPLPTSLSQAVTGFMARKTRALEAKDQMGQSTTAWTEQRKFDESMRAAYYALQELAREYANVCSCCDRDPEFLELQALELAQINEQISTIGNAIIDDLMNKLLPKGHEVELEVSATNESGFLHARELVEMYRRYCGGQFGFELLESQQGGGGFRSARIRITGKNAYAYFFGETGQHRFEAANKSRRDSKIYTNFVQVLALPRLDAQLVSFSDRDVEATYLKASGSGGQNVQKNETGVRLVHRPTGIIVVATEQRSKIQNMETARRRLQAKLDQLERDRVLAIENDIRQALDDRHVRTYDHTRGEISDSATGQRYAMTPVMTGRAGQMFQYLVLAYLERLILDS